VRDAGAARNKVASLTGTERPPRGVGIVRPPPRRGEGGQFRALPSRVGSDFASLTGPLYMGGRLPVRDAPPQRPSRVSARILVGPPHGSHIYGTREGDLLKNILLHPFTRNTTIQTRFYKADFI